MSDNYKFDEENALTFIRQYIGNKISDQYTDDELLYVIDTIWDYYERKGFLSLSADITDEEMLDQDDLTAYVKKTIALDDDIEMDPTDIAKIVKGELEYEESLEDFV